MRIATLVVCFVAVAGCGPQQAEEGPRRRVSGLAYAEYGHTPPPTGVTPLFAASGVQGAWTVVNTTFTASTMLLLTDGRLMVQDENAPNWWLLKPDPTGSYVKGTWTQAAAMSKGRLYYCSAVLKDGRVAVLGGEYTGAAGQTEDATGEIYDPVTNGWHPMPVPAGWSEVGDAACAVLPDGRLLLGSIGDDKSALFDPATATWSDAGTKLAPSAEESWVTMPDGSVLTVDCSPTRTQGSELWVAGKGWSDAGALPVALVEASSEEIGPALHLADGRVLFIGATGHSALYTPSATAGQLGKWSAGPDLPTDTQGQVVAKDAPAVLLPNGHALVTASSEGASGWGGPTNFYDFDTTVTPIKVTAATAAPNNAQAPYEGRLMMLPTGQVVYAQGSQQLAFFDPGVTPTITAPHVTAAPAQALPGATFKLSGTRLNGESQTVGYGDDAAQATNYPLVRLTNGATKAVSYARTHDHSTMAIATGATVQSTMVTLPSSLPAGSYALQVVTNGVASAAVTLAVGSGSCSGCVDGSGACQPGNSVAACGAGGGSCLACAAGQSCSNGACVAMTCGGCVDASGACQPGTAKSDCGSGGAVCAVCGTTQACSGGKCVAVTCSGCVDGHGACQPGTSTGACGARGGACVACKAGQTCSNGACFTANTCAHAICVAGKALAKTCDPCVTKICKADGYCCATAWDSICVGEVASICGETCH